MSGAVGVTCRHVCICSRVTLMPIDRSLPWICHGALVMEAVPRTFPKRSFPSHWWCQWISCCGGCTSVCLLTTRRSKVLPLA